MLSQVVKTVGQYGYLGNRELAAVHFCDNLRKAQRATAQLVAENHLIETRIGNSSRFCLPGQTALFDNVTGHRDASNAILIDALVTGIATSVIPDRQIQLNQTGYTLNNKIPDGLLLDEYDGPEGKRVDYSWVEVENSERSGRDVAVLGNWVMRQFMSNRNWHVLPEYRNGFLANVLVVISNPAADKIESRLLGFIQREYTSPAEVDFISEILPLRLQFMRYGNQL